MRKLRKFGILSLILIAALIGYETITNWRLLYPERYFSHTKVYNEFKIYADQPIQGDIETLLDNVSYRLENTLNYDKGEYNIFLCENIEYYGTFAKKAGRPALTQGFNLQPLNHIFINLSFIRDIREKNDGKYKYSILEGNASHIIAHEICHQLIAGEIGFFKMRKTDNWKLEGFCEYAASKRIKKGDTTCHFPDLVDSFFNGDFSNIPPGRKFYIHSLLLTEYLLDHKGFSFSEFINTELDENELLKEIESDYAVP